MYVELYAVFTNLKITKKLQPIISVHFKKSKKIFISCSCKSFKYSFYLLLYLWPITSFHLWSISISLFIPVHLIGCCLKCTTGWAWISYMYLYIHIFLSFKPLKHQLIKGPNKQKTNLLFLRFDILSLSKILSFHIEFTIP